VWFGEPLPEAAWHGAVTATEACDVLFSIGTSSLVHPAAELPMRAARRGAVVIQVNPSATALDRVAQFNLVGLAGTVMPDLLAATWDRSDK
jgi:NAD-dependent deacetylase